MLDQKAKTSDSDAYKIKKYTTILGQNVVAAPVNATASTSENTFHGSGAAGFESPAWQPKELGIGLWSQLRATNVRAGYKANPTYDNFLREHSSFYRRHSAASQAQDADRRASQASDANAAAAAQAASNVAEGQRRGSIQSAGGGAATVNARKGSVVVLSDVDRKDSVFGMEATAGVRADEGRRPSTSLASDLLHKMKGNK